MVIDLNC